MISTLSKSDVIAHQLSLAAPETVTFAEGGSTLLTPARWAPELAGEAQVPLEGVWEVTYWPFAMPESALLTGSEAVWGEVAQPGKVFYYDPEQSPDSIPNWNRVTQEHLDPEDGALIRRTVEIPAAWSGKRILLRFEGIYPAGKIYWDGELIGEQWSGLTPIEIDVTGRALPGDTHTVAVRFYRRHAAIQLDMPRHALDFTGLCRSAFLHAVEPVHLADIRLVPALNGDNVSGVLTAEVLLRNTTAQAAQAALTVELADAGGHVLAIVEERVEVPANGSAPVILHAHTGHIKPWNAEEPVRYTASLRLSVMEQTEQVVSQRIGFRRFEVQDGRPLLNGNPVKFRGVNHLTFHADGGLYTPKAWLRDCLAMMKRANVNSIRTHFFGPRELTELCDEMGFYLLQELPIDWGTNYVQETSLLGPMLHRMEAGVRRDRNAPSVMVWSVGNENMPATEAAYPDFLAHLRLCGAMVKHVDPSRPTMFPPPGPANAIRGIFDARLGEIADTHYSFNLIRQFNETDTVINPRTWEPTFETHTREELLAMGWSGAWFSSEYGINNLQTDLLNAPYTSIICDVREDPLSGKNSQQVFIDRLSREWGYMRDDPRCLGGAYFCWIAAGAGDPWGWMRWGEDADWGILTADLQPKSMFWAMRVLFSPVRFPERVSWRKGQTTFQLPIHNGYNGIDLSQCTLRTQMSSSSQYMSMLREWRDVPMSGAPGAMTEISVPIWKTQILETLEKGQPAMCRCTVLDPTGYRSIMADVMIIPGEIEEGAEAPMPIGPDAV